MYNPFSPVTGTPPQQQCSQEGFSSPVEKALSPSKEHLTTKRPDTQLETMDIGMSGGNICVSKPQQKYTSHGKDITPDEEGYIGHGDGERNPTLSPPLSKKARLVEPSLPRSSPKIQSVVSNIGIAFICDWHVL